MASQGTVRFFDESKGFGFIAINEGVDVFVHRKHFVGVTTLNAGDVVSFDVSFDDIKNKMVAESGRRPSGAAS